MEKYYIIFLTLGLLFVDPSYQQSSCEDDVNVCTVSFTLAQQTQASSGFNLTAICSIVDEFMTCVNTALAPCDVITRNTLMSAIDQLIEIYTNAPYGCNLDFAETFEYGNCSQEVTKCAFFKYDAEEQKDNATQACKEFDNFLQCMRENTTACKGAEQVEITQSIQNTTTTFSKCPYACNMPDLICTTVSSTTTASTKSVTIETIYVSASPSLSSIAVSDIDLSEYYMVTLAPSEVFYDPSDVMSMYSGDVTDFYTPGISEDVIADETALYESETYSDIQPTSTDAQTTPSSVDTTPETSTSLITTTTPKPATPTTELQSTSRTTPTTTTTSKPSTTDTTKTTNSVQENSTPLQKDSTTDTKTDTSAKDTSLASTEKQTTATPTTTTKKPTTTKTPVKTSRATARVTRKTTTDFPTPNYDNAGEINHQSAVIVLASLIFAFMS